METPLQIVAGGNSLTGSVTDLTVALDTDDRTRDVTGDNTEKHDFSLLRTGP
jgi:hypothetical protein